MIFYSQGVGKMIIARNKEMNKIYELASSKNFEFLVMYGRRRVGKTELLKELSRNKKTIFYAAQEKNDKLNLDEFIKVLKVYFNEKNDFVFDNWKSAFEYFVEKVSKIKAKTILIIDEFPYIANENPTIKSILQNIIDHKLKSLNVLLILCGSSISSMEEGVLGKKSPLYGRATAKMEVKPLGYIDSFKFMGDYLPEEKFIAYGILGGIPYYLNEFDYKKSIYKNIENKIVNDFSMLYDEPQTLLRMELREPAIYNSILEAIASGKNKINEISRVINEENYKCSKYINTLRNIHLINRITPCGDKETSKNSLYEISDNYINFWFKYLFKNKNYYELLSAEAATKEIMSDINNYMGRVFEKISLEYMIEMAKNHNLPFIPAYYGKWWGGNSKTKKQDDVDVLMLSKDKKQGIFCECKYRKEKFDLKELIDLETAAESFDYVKDKYFYLISKGGFTKSVIESESKNIKLITLDDMINL